MVPEMSFLRHIECTPLSCAVGTEIRTIDNVPFSTNPDIARKISRTRSATWNTWPGHAWRYFRILDLPAAAMLYINQDCNVEYD